MHKMHVFKSDFVKGVITLGAGTGFAQIVPILVSPLLTRFYSPDDFGIFALYIAIYSIAAILVTGRYELAVMLPRQDGDAINLVAVSSVLACMMSVVLFVVVLAFKEVIPALLQNQGIQGWLYFVPVSVLLLAIYQTMHNWNNRRKRYRRIAAGKIAQSTATGLFSVLLGYINAGAVGLLYGALLGQIAVVGMWFAAFWKREKVYLSRIKKTRALALAKKYKEFPKKTITSSLINAVYNNGKFLLLAIVLPPAVVGYLYLTFRVLLFPVSVISMSVADVLFQNASVWIYGASNKEYMYEKIKKIFLVLFLVSLLPSMLVYYFAGELFAVVFGERWRESGVYASVLSVALCAQFCCAPLCKVFYVIGCQGRYLAWESARLFLVYAPVLILGVLQATPEEIIYSMTAAIVLSYFLLVVLLRYSLLEKR